LRYTDKFDDANLPGQLQVTVTLKRVSVGTELNIVQEGLPDVIPLEACYLGWQESLRNLAKLVEPEINPFLRRRTGPRLPDRLDDGNPHILRLHLPGRVLGALERPRCTQASMAARHA
jgi:hypothetical protein